MPQTFSSLSQVIIDDELEVRRVAEICVQSIGRICGRESRISTFEISLQTILNYLLPRVRGEVPGMDTAHHRKILNSHSLIFLQEDVGSSFSHRL
jgi:hypothetical protein